MIYTLLLDYQPDIFQSGRKYVFRTNLLKGKAPQHLFESWRKVKMDEKVCCMA